ncbi:hypothetical protein EV361DRAFT_950531 [Lentinula raphanica]|nr:hypothetical protein EV360DRAFT_90109 [Lentinula raphanica]KAJ3816891.1 hypothetical protein F5880DRAFT_1618812 [Lentinula raphanica]KAJ3970494.1 hypothetical protein EV361DRAFT_950531 [Lentinula raphanica]
MAAEPNRPDFFGSHLLYSPFWDENGLTFFGLTLDSTREEIKTTMADLGLFLCFMVCLSVYMASVLTVFYHVTVFACSWLYEHIPGIRNKELERREKALELKEAMVARKARTLALDVEIGVCNRLVKTLKHSLAATEVRKLELENERESLLQDNSSDDLDATDN